MARVLVTGLFTQAGLFAVRQFGRMGFEVTAADTHPLAFGMHSRYVSRRVRLPPLSQPRAYTDALLAELARGHDYYFPGFEEIFLMSERQDEMRARSVLPPSRHLLDLHDKARLVGLAAQLALPTPETHAPSSMAEAENLIATIDYPTVVKLRQSRNSGGLRFVREPVHLRNAFAEVVERNRLGEDELPILQRWVRGREICAFALCQAGRIVGLVTYAGVRSLPRSGGTTVARETVDAPRTRAAVERFVAALGWTGFIGFDLIEDEHSGQAFVIDCNPRATTSLPLAHFGGMDLLTQWLAIADGRQAAPLGLCKAGVRSRTGFADLLWFASTFRPGPEPWRERRELRRVWLRDRSYHQDITDLRDPMPTVVLYAFLALQSVRLLTGASEGSQLFLEHNAVRLQAPR